MSQEKVNEYSCKIISAISEVFNEDSDFFIGREELEEESGNVTDFFHALTNIAPVSFYREITGDKVSLLKFNHIANELLFQYLTIKK